MDRSLVSPLEPLGTLLLRKGLISQEQLEEALDLVRRSGTSPDTARLKLGEALIKVKAVTQEILTETLVEQYQPILPGLELKKTILPEEIDMQAARAMLDHLDHSPNFLPIKNDAIVASSPADYFVARDILDTIGFPSVSSPYLATPAVIAGAWAYVHQSFTESGSGTPREQFMSILREAVRAGASDVLLRPVRDEYEVVVRVHGTFDVDGPTRKTFPWKTGVQMYNAVLAIKEWGLNPTNKNLPQCGGGKIEGSDVPVRVTALPSVQGGVIVVRIYQSSSGVRPLSEMSYTPDLLPKLRSLARIRGKLVLAVGPTGSGKTTLLHGILQEARDVARDTAHIVTVEDPVEVVVPRTTQLYGPDENDLTDEQRRLGVPTMNTHLRNILRASPDIILVGEIRDHRSAVAAVRAAQTGHLTLSTLHVNQAQGTLHRLLELGEGTITPGVIADILAAVVAQRLLPKLCPACRREASSQPIVEAFESTKLNELHPRAFESLQNAKFYDYGLGPCDTCGGLRRVGLIPVAELLLFTPDVRKAFLEDHVFPAPKRPYYIDAVKRAMDGDISVTEVANLVLSA